MSSLSTARTAFTIGDLNPDLIHSNLSSPGSFLLNSLLVAGDLRASRDDCRVATCLSGHPRGRLLAAAAASRCQQLQFK